MLKGRSLVKVVVLLVLWGSDNLLCLSDDSGIIEDHSVATEKQLEVTRKSSWTQWREQIEDPTILRTWTKHFEAILGGPSWIHQVLPPSMRRVIPTSQQQKSTSSPAKYHHRFNVFLAESSRRRARTFELERSDLSVMRSIQHDHDLFPGMVLQVEDGFTLSEEGENKDDTSDGDSIEIAHVKRIPYCPADNEEINQRVPPPQAGLDVYQLVEPMHLELGVASKHTSDYAYTPVAVVADVAPMDSQQPYAWWNWWFSYSTTKTWWKTDEDINEKYNMGETAFAGGSHGEVWRGRRLCCQRNSNASEEGAEGEEDPPCTEKDNEPNLIFKRLDVERGYDILEAGLREIYFGNYLAHGIPKELFTTYINHFFREVPKPNMEEKALELWIVFQDAGPSLRSYLYTPVSTSDFVMYQHSFFWQQLRRRANPMSRNRDEDEDSDNLRSCSALQLVGETRASSPKDHVEDLGQTDTVSAGPVMKRVLHQIMTAAAYLHEQGIVHRDIKPSNTMCQTNLDLETLKLRVGNELKIHCVLGDFSSGWDMFTAHNLYTNGPSMAEQTIEYAPPESVLGPSWEPFNKQKPQSYDSWSIGVLALEMLLGTPNVFTVDQRTTAVLTQKMEKQGASPEDIQKALYLAALSQFCIYVPSSDSSKRQEWPLGSGDPLHKTSMVKSSCTLHDFHRALRARDPLGLGFESSPDHLFHLIWQLLAWNPTDRITAAEALNHTYFADEEFLVPGSHNALESLMLDPRMDFNLSDSVHNFTCPKCGRVFSDWKSCQQHAVGRKHAKFCKYDRSNLPTCLNAHSMLPAHSMSGYCDIQGRRRVIEDFHSIHLLPSRQFYGLFDGHTGNLASKYAAATFHGYLSEELANLDERVMDDSNWKGSVEINVTNAFRTIHEQFLTSVANSSYRAMDQSGTTVTSVFVSDEAVVVANIGDSRAVLSSYANKTESQQTEVRPIQLTIDHVASNPAERKFVEDRGGFVSSSSGGRLARVNGTLAITRSIGDATLSPYLSRDPHIVSMTRDEVRQLCGRSSQGDEPCFIILASDGLWDMVSNQEAIDMVVETMSSYTADKEHWREGGAFQEASEVLTLEAYVRGSTDNIGVCVIGLS